MTKLEIDLLLALADASGVVETHSRGASKPAVALRDRFARLAATHPAAMGLAERAADLQAEILLSYKTRPGGDLVADLLAASSQEAIGALELGLTPDDIRAGVRVEVVDGRWCAVHPSGKRTMGPACG